MEGAVDPFRGEDVRRVRQCGPWGRRRCPVSARSCGTLSTLLGTAVTPQTGVDIEGSEERGVWMKVEVPPTSLTAVVVSVVFYLYKHQGMSHNQVSVPVLPATKPSPTLFVAVSKMGHGPSQARGCREGGRGAGTTHKQLLFLLVPWV